MGRRVAESDSDFESVYERLVASTGVDRDSVHDLVSKHGPEILERDFPYLLVVARGLRKSRVRRSARRFSLLEQYLEREPSRFDPMDLAVVDDELRRTLENLVSLSELDALIVWLFATGYSDAEIQLKLPERFGELSLDQIRKRRSRAREELRRLANADRL